MIPKPYSMIYLHWPKTAISNIWPVNRSMDHLCTCYGHDGCNMSFCMTILVVSPNASISLDLICSVEVLNVFSACKLATIVAEILGRNNTLFSTEVFEGNLCLESGMCSEDRLELDVDKAGSLVNEDASSNKSIAL